MTTVCLGALTLTDKIAATKNDEKGLRWFRTVFSHLQKYQKVGVRPVFLIQLSCILVFHQAYFLCILPYIILLFIDEEYYMFILSYLWILPRVMIISVIFPYSESMIERKLEKILESTCDIFRLSTCQSMVHYLPLTFIFIKQK